MSILTNDSNSMNRSPRVGDQNPKPPTILEGDKDNKAGCFRSRIEELVKLVEPLRDNANRFNLTINEIKEKGNGGLPFAKDNEQVELVQKYLKAILFRLDPLVESVFSLIEPDNLNGTAKDFKQRLNITTNSVLKPSLAGGVAKPVAAVKAKASNKAPPPGKKSAEPKKAHAKEKGQGPTKQEAEETAKIDPDLNPEQMPDPSLVPKPIIWQGIARIKIAGSVWDNLLKEDRLRPTALTLRQKLETIGSESYPEAASETTTESWLKTLVRFEVDFQNLDELFFEKAEDKGKGSEKKTSIADAAAAAAKTRVQTILSPKRTQLIEISLKSLNLDDDFGNIQNAIDNLIFDEGLLQGVQLLQMGSGNEDQTPGNRDSEGYTSQSGSRKKVWGLNVDRLERLIPAHPTLDEVSSLKTLFANCTADQKIAQADRFLLALSRIDRFPERASSCLTRLIFEKDASSIAEKLLKLLSVVDNANDSLANGVFKSILALIVKAGNYINCRSRRALVSGIQVSALESLRQVKSIDGKKTFVRVIAEHIEKQFPLAWKQIDWLGACSETSDISPYDVKVSLEAISKKLKVIETELKRPDVNEKYKEFFGAFYEKSAKRLALLDERIKEAHMKLVALATAFAASVTPASGSSATGGVASASVTSESAVSGTAASGRTTEDCGVPFRKETCEELLGVMKKLGCFGKDLFAAHRDIQHQQEENRRRDLLKSRQLRESAQRDRDRKTSTGSANGGGKSSSFRKNIVTPVLSTLQSEVSDEPVPNSPFQQFGGRIATLSGSTPTNYPEESVCERSDFCPESGGGRPSKPQRKNMLKPRQSVPSQFSTNEPAGSLRFPEPVDKIPAVRSVAEKKGAAVAREGVKPFAHAHHDVVRRERFSEVSPRPETPVTPPSSFRRNRSTFHPTTHSGCSSNLSRSGGPITTEGNQLCYSTDQMPTFASPAPTGRPAPGRYEHPNDTTGVRKSRHQVATDGNRPHSVAADGLNIRMVGGGGQQHRKMLDFSEEFASTGDAESDLYHNAGYQAVSRQLPQKPAATRQRSIRARCVENSEEALFLGRERVTPAQSPPTSARSHLTHKPSYNSAGPAGIFENQGASAAIGPILTRMVDTYTVPSGRQLINPNRTVSAGCAGPSVGGGHAIIYNGRVQTEKPIYYEGSPTETAVYVNEYIPQSVLDHPGQGSPAQQSHDGIIFVHQSPGSSFASNWMGQNRQPQWGRFP